MHMSKKKLGWTDAIDDTQFHARPSSPILWTVRTRGLRQHHELVLFSHHHAIVSANILAAVTEQGGWVYRILNRDEAINSLLSLRTSIHILLPYVYRVPSQSCQDSATFVHPNFIAFPQQKIL